MTTKRTRKARLVERIECQQIDYGRYGANYPCHLEAGHRGPHECMDKDECNHNWWTPGMEPVKRKRGRPKR